VLLSTSSRLGIRCRRLLEWLWPGDGGGCSVEKEVNASCFPLLPTKGHKGMSVLLSLQGGFKKTVRENTQFAPGTDTQTPSKNGDQNTEGRGCRILLCLIEAKRATLI
jgi:hypothetical protein